MEGKLNAKIYKSTVSGAVDLVVLRQKPIRMHLTVGKNAVSKLRSISFESFLNPLRVPTCILDSASLRGEKCVLRRFTKIPKSTVSGGVDLVVLRPKHLRMHL